MIARYFLKFRTLISRLLMNIIRYIVLSSKRNHTYEHILAVKMIGQSKINAFFKRQSSGEERVKDDSIRDDTPECTLPLKRKRDENNSEVLLLY